MPDEFPQDQPEPIVPPPRDLIYNPGVVVAPAVYAEGLEVIDGSELWLEDQQLPEKPPGVEYGIRYKRFQFGKSREIYHQTDFQLLDAIESKPKKIQYVYLPDHDRAVPLRSLNLYQPIGSHDLKHYALRTLISRGALAILALLVVAVFAYLFFKEKIPLYSDENPKKVSRHMMCALGFFLLALLGGVLPICDAFIQWAFYPKRQPLPQLKQSIVHGAMFNSWIRRNAFLRSWPTWLLVLVYIGVYLSQHLAPGSYHDVTGYATIKSGLIRESGEWWRLFTATLMHSDVFVAIHLCFNSLGLIVLGSFVQRITNPALVPILFVVSAFGGAVASAMYLMLLPDQMLGSLGASGGVLGLLGFLFVMVVARKKHLPYEFRTLVFHNIIRITILGLLMVFFIDHGGHLGGFISGVFCGVIYQLLHRGKWSVPWTPAKSILTAGSFGVVFFGVACCVDLFYFKGELFVSNKLPKIPWGSLASNLEILGHKF